ncbi:MAG: LysM peptidoglycan-binding domain-containing protein, partial [Pseudomonadota bacterium]
MTAIVFGQGLGLFETSSSSIATRSSSTMGQWRARYNLNASNGNLIIQHQDELLVGLGQDQRLFRTYNSQGLMNGDDGWRFNFEKTARLLSGDAFAPDSQIERIAADGFRSLFVFQTEGTYKGSYLGIAGDGAHDTFERVQEKGINYWLYREGSTGFQEYYTADGKLAFEEDRLGRRTQFNYNAAGQLVSINDASGQSLMFTYYTSGQVKQLNIATYEIDSKGNATKAIQQTHIHYTYDAENRLENVAVDLTPKDNTIDDGHTIGATYTYNAKGLLSQIIRSDGVQLNYHYDNEGRVKQVIEGGQTVLTLEYERDKTHITDANNQVWTSILDPETGRLLSVIEPLGESQLQRAETQYHYDQSGNLTRVIDANQNFVTYEYDQGGNRIRERDGLGNTIIYRYNSNNQLIAESRFIDTDPDGEGRADIEVSPGQFVDGNNKNPLKHLTQRWVYNDKSELAYTLSAEGHVTLYEYNANHQLTSQGQLASKHYPVDGLTALQDVSDEQIKEWLSRSHLGQIQWIHYDYDFRGQVINERRFAHSNEEGLPLASDDDIYLHRVYDAQGRLLAELPYNNPQRATYHTYDGYGRLLSTIDPQGHKETRRYEDALNQIIRTRKSGAIETQTYDQRGNLVAQTLTAKDLESQKIVHHYNAKGLREYSINAEGGKTQWFYDHHDRVIKTIDAEGRIEERTYTKAGKLHQLIQRDPQNPNNDRKQEYLYDQAGRLQYRINAEGVVTRFEYDGADRLLREIEVSRGYWDSQVNVSAKRVEIDEWRQGVAAIAPTQTAYIESLSQDTHRASVIAQTELHTRGPIQSHQLLTQGTLESFVTTHKKITANVVGYYRETSPNVIKNEKGFSLDVSFSRYSPKGYDRQPIEIRATVKRVNGGASKVVNQYTLPTAELRWTSQGFRYWYNKQRDLPLAAQGLTAGNYEVTYKLTFAETPKPPPASYEIPVLSPDSASLKEHITPPITETFTIGDSPRGSEIVWNFPAGTSAKNISSATLTNGRHQNVAGVSTISSNAVWVGEISGGGPYKLVVNYESGETITINGINLASTSGTVPLRDANFTQETFKSDPKSNIMALAINPSTMQSWRSNYDRIDVEVHHWNEVSNSWEVLLTPAKNYIAQTTHNHLNLSTEQWQHGRYRILAQGFKNGAKVNGNLLPAYYGTGTQANQKYLEVGLQPSAIKQRLSWQGLAKNAAQNNVKVQVYESLDQQAKGEALQEYSLLKSQLETSQHNNLSYHSLILNGLQNGKTYYYRITQSDDSQVQVSTVKGDFTVNPPTNYKQNALATDAQIFKHAEQAQQITVSGQTVKRDWSLEGSQVELGQLVQAWQQQNKQKNISVNWNTIAQVSVKVTNNRTNQVLSSWDNDDRLWLDTFNTQSGSAQSLNINLTSGQNGRFTENHSYTIDTVITLSNGEIIRLEGLTHEVGQQYQGKVTRTYLGWSLSGQDAASLMTSSASVNVDGVDYRVKTVDDETMSQFFGVGFAPSHSQNVYFMLDRSQESSVEADLRGSKAFIEHLALGDHHYDFQFADNNDTVVARGLGGFVTALNPQEDRIPNDFSTRVQDLREQTSKFGNGDVMTRERRYFYNDDGQRIGRLDAEGYLTEWRYNEAGQLQQQIRYASRVNQALRPTSSEQTRQDLTQPVIYGAYALANLRPEESAKDLHRFTFYDGTGQTIGEVNEQGFLTELQRDVKQNKTRTIRYEQAVDVNALIDDFQTRYRGPKTNLAYQEILIATGERQTHALQQGTFSGNNLRFKAVNGNNDQALPSWVSMNEQTGELNVNASAQGASALLIKVEATDERDQTTTSYVNLKPEQDYRENLSPLIRTEKTAITYQIPNDAFDTELTSPVRAYWEQPRYDLKQGRYESYQGTLPFGMTFDAATHSLHISENLSDTRDYRIRLVTENERGEEISRFVTIQHPAQAQFTRFNNIEIEADDTIDWVFPYDFAVGRSGEALTRWSFRVLKPIDVGENRPLVFPMSDQPIIEIIESPFKEGQKLEDIGLRFDPVTQKLTGNVKAGDYMIAMTASNVEGEVISTSFQLKVKKPTTDWFRPGPILPGPIWPSPIEPPFGPAPIEPPEEPPIFDPPIIGPGPIEPPIVIPSPIGPVEPPVEPEPPIFDPPIIGPGPIEPPIVIPSPIGPVEPPVEPEPPIFDPPVPIGPPSLDPGFPGFNQPLPVEPNPFSFAAFSTMAQSESVINLDISEKTSLAKALIDDTSANQIGTSPYKEKWVGGEANYTWHSALDHLRSADDLENAWMIEQTKDALNRVIKQQSYYGDVSANPVITTENFAYNASGELLHQTIEQTNTHDGSQRMDRAMAYQVDAFGRRTAQAEGEQALKIIQAAPLERDDGFNEDVWRFSYNRNNHRIAQVDALGQETRWLVNQLGEQEARFVKIKNNSWEAERWEYNAFGEVKSERRLLSRVTTPTLNALNKAQHAHDEIMTSTYDRLGRIKQMVDVEGLTQETIYNERGDRIFTHVRDDKDVLHTQYALYDALGQRTTSGRYHPDYYSESLETSTTRYDAFGRVIERTERIQGNHDQGVTTRTRYEQRGREIITELQQRQQAGEVLENTIWQLRSQTLTDYRGRVIEHIDADSSLVTQVYDDAKAQRKTLRDNQSIETRIIDSQGNTLYQKDAAGTIQHSVYDLRGNIKSIATEQGGTVFNEYDALGQRVKTTDAEGVVTRFFYDAQGRLEKRIDDAEGLKLVTTFVFDGLGRVVEENFRGRLTRTAYFNLGEKLDNQTLTLDAVRTYRETGETTLITTLYTDKQGRIVRRAQGDSANPQLRVTAYEHDIHGRVITETQDPNGLSLQSEYAYNANGQRVWSQDPAGEQTWWVYDDNGQKRFTITDDGQVVEHRNTLRGDTFMTMRHGQTLDVNAIKTLSASDKHLKLDIVEKHVSLDPAQTTRTITLTDARGFERAQLTALQWQQEAAQGKGAYQYAVTLMHRDGVGRLLEQVQLIDPIYIDEVIRAEDVNALAQFATVREALIEELESKADLVGERKVTKAWRYNAQGDLIAERDGTGAVTRHWVDHLGQRLRSETYDVRVELTNSNWASAFNNWSEIPQDTSLRRMHYRYDALGRLRFSVSGAGHVTETRYHVTGEVASVRRYAQAMSSEQLTGLMDAQQTVKATQNQADQFTEYRYDQAGRRTSEQKTWWNPNTATETLTAESWTLNAVDQRKTFTNALDKQWIYHYDTAGRLKAEEKPADDQKRVLITEYEYNKKGQLLHTTEAKGTTKERKTSYVYNRQGEQVASLKSAVGTYDAATKTWSAARGHLKTTATEYNALGQATAYTSDNIQRYRWSDLAGREIWTIDAAGYVTEKIYDALGRVTETRRYSRSVNVEEVVADNKIIVEKLQQALADDPLMRSLEQVYDGENRVVNTTAGADLTTYEYNAFGETQTMTQSGQSWQFVKEKAQYDVVDETRTESYDYDLDGNRIEHTDAMGYISQWDYDAFGQLTDERLFEEVGSRDTDKARVKHWEYDTLGRQVKEEQLGIHVTTVNTRGFKTEGPRTLTQITEFDALGRVVRSESASGAVTTHRYDALGHEVYRETANGLVTEWERDEHGQATKVTHSDNGVIGKVKVRIGVESAVYDAWGRKVWSQQQGQAEKMYVWDAEDRLIDETQVVQNFSQDWQRQESQTLKTRYHYDRAGQLIRTEVMHDGVMQRQNERNYNAFGEVTFQHQDGVDWLAEYNQNGVVVRQWIDTRLTEYRYNSFGEVLEEIAVGEKEDATDDRITRYARDSLGRILDTWGATGHTQRSYDRFGNLIAMVDALGHKVTYQYDERDLRIQEHHHHVELTEGEFQDVITQWGYDTQGLQTWEQRGDQIRKQHYNLVGQMTHRWDGEGNLTRMTYDALGRQHTLTDALGRMATTQYHANGEVDRQTLTVDDNTYELIRFEYDEAGRVVKSVARGERENLTRYDSLGHVVGTRDVGGIERHHTYDVAGRLVEERLGKIGEQKTRSWSYGLAGELTLYTDLSGRTREVFYNAFGEQERETTRERGYIVDERVYAYNAWGHLKTVTRYSGYGNSFALAAQTEYQHDLLGRREFTSHTIHTQQHRLRPSHDVGQASLTREMTTRYNGLGYLLQATTETLDSSVNLGDFVGETAGFDGYLPTTNTSLDYSYDQHGNRTRVGTTIGFGSTRNDYYTYNKNNQVLWSRARKNDKGELELLASQSRVITYDALGREATRSASWQTNIEAFANGEAEIREYQVRHEVYHYDDLGQREKTTGYEVASFGGTAQEITWQTREYNLAGDLLVQDDFREDGQLARRISRQLDSAGRILVESTYEGYQNITFDRMLAINVENAERLVSRIDYRMNGQHNSNSRGELAGYSVSSYEKGQFKERLEYQHYYIGYDQMQESSTRVVKYNDNNDQIGTSGISERFYNGRGELIGGVSNHSINVKNTPRWWRAFLLTAEGEQLGRIDFSTVAGHDKYREMTYSDSLVVDGQRLGMVVHKKKHDDSAHLIRWAHERTDFDPHLARQDALPELGGSESLTRVQTGDTLASIAQRVYGDASLWYLLSEANGVNDANLEVGMSLRVPVVDSLSRNQVGTFKAFSPDDVIGNFAPSPVPPPFKGECEGLAKVITVAVTIMVTAASGNPALGAAAGDYAGQYTRIIGNGDFDWGAWARGSLNPFSGNPRDWILRRINPLHDGNQHAYNYEQTAIAASSAAITAPLPAPSGFNWASLGAAALRGTVQTGANYGLNRLAGNNPSWSNRSLLANIGGQFASGALGGSPSDVA